MVALLADAVCKPADHKGPLCAAMLDAGFAQISTLPKLSRVYV